MTNTSPVLVSYLKYLTVILLKLVTIAHQISNKSSRHNKKLTSREEQNTADFNRRRKQECPMQGRIESSLYKCVAISNNIPPKTYVGTSEGDWKTRYFNHTKSFRNLKYSKETTLSGVL